VEIICFIPKCEINLKPYDFSFNYIIQSYYRLSSRKNHETLDFEKNPNAHLIFFSFLTMFNFMKFENLGEFYINFYGLSITDEVDLQLENRLEFVREFGNLMKRIKASKFNTDELMKFNFEILEFIDKIKNNFPLEMFKDTREKIKEEIEECNIIFLLIFIYLVVNKKMETKLK
jgi:hypothetical protein